MLLCRRFGPATSTGLLIDVMSLEKRESEAIPITPCEMNRNGGGNIQVACQCHTLHPTSHISQTRYSRSAGVSITQFHLVGKECRTHHSNHHQCIIPAKSLDHTQSHKTSQQHRRQRNGEEDGGDNRDNLTAAADHGAY